MTETRNVPWGRNGKLLPKTKKRLVSFRLSPEQYQQYQESGCAIRFKRLLDAEIKAKGLQ